MRFVFCPMRRRISSGGASIQALSLMTICTPYGARGFVSDIAIFRQQLLRWRTSSGLLENRLAPLEVERVAVECAPFRPKGNPDKEVVCIVSPASGSLF